MLEQSVDCLDARHEMSMPIKITSSTYSRRHRVPTNHLVGALTEPFVSLDSGRPHHIDLSDPHRFPMLVLQSSDTRKGA
jgi:hypothetical protein